MRQELMKKLEENTKKTKLMSNFNNLICRHSTIKICLNCNCWEIFQIKKYGWWSPRCDHWNGKKGTNKNPYGPCNTCPFFLEHTVLTQRNSFILKGENHMPLVKFFQAIEKNEDYAMFLDPNKRQGLIGVYHRLEDRENLKKTTMSTKEVVKTLNEHLYYIGEYGFFKNIKVNGEDTWAYVLRDD